MNFTPKQLAILKYIFDYQLQKTYSPTLKEIGFNFKVSAVTVHEHITALEKKGALRRRPYDARSIELTDMTLSLFNADKMSSDKLKFRLADYESFLTKVADGWYDREQIIEISKKMLQGKTFKEVEVEVSNG